MEGNEQNTTEVKHLLASIRDETPETSYISLTICDRLRQPVFAETSCYFKPSATYTQIPKIESKGCCLYVALNILQKDKNNINNLTQVLWLLSGEVVSKGEFSFGNCGFTRFSDKDFLIINFATQLKDNDEEV